MRQRLEIRVISLQIGADFSRYKEHSALFFVMYSFIAIAKNRTW